MFLSDNTFLMLIILKLLKRQKFLIKQANKAVKKGFEELLNRILLDQDKKN